VSFAGPKHPATRLLGAPDIRIPSVNQFALGTRSMACSKSVQGRGRATAPASVRAKADRLAAFEMASRSAGAKPSILSAKMNDEPRSLARETGPAT
jgi:hypothetical protein